MSRQPRDQDGDDADADHSEMDQVEAVARDSTYSDLIAAAGSIASARRTGTRHAARPAPSRTSTDVPGAEMSTMDDSPSRSGGPSSGSLLPDRCHRRYFRPCWESSSEVRCPPTSDPKATMKKMTCKQLGGACELEFHADSFDGIAELSKKHGMEMFRQADQAHLQAMEEMKSLMADPNAMKRWFDGKRREFDALPEDG